MVPSALGEALRLVGQGAAVLPCWPDSKVPVWSRGVHSATRDPEVLEHHFRRRPRDNVAIATGKGGVGLDLDRHHPGADGVASFAALCARAGAERPRTWTDATPHDGLHLLFAAPPGLDVGGLVHRLGNGIDVLGRGRIMVMPPSVVGARRYRRVVDMAPVTLPGWLAALMTTKRERPPAVASTERRASPHERRWAQAALRGEVARVAGAREGEGRWGGRNGTLNTAAYLLGQLVGSGLLDAEEVTTKLTAAALACGLDESEIADTIPSGLRAGFSNPRRMRSR
jgi:hypothetical protein